MHLIETSPRLRAAQAARLQQACWHHELATVPRRPMILLANEFLDALPIRQFVRRGEGWTERFVDAGRWIEQPAEPAAVPTGRGAAEGDIVELQRSGPALRRRGRRPLHGSTQARRCCSTTGRSAVPPATVCRRIADRRPVDPLSPAGSADLTAHVDFADLAEVARIAGGAVQGPAPQGAFLTELGLFQRTDRLARNRPAGEARALLGAASRLAGPDAMGRLFKVLAVYSPDCPPLPGFPLR